MKTAWTKGLESDAAKELKLHFKSGLHLRKRLATLCQDKIDAKDRASMKDTEYENSGWAFKQADSQGYKRAMKEIMSLIEE